MTSCFNLFYGLLKHPHWGGVMYTRGVLKQNGDANVKSCRSLYRYIHPLGGYTYTHYKELPPKGGKFFIVQVVSYKRCFQKTHKCDKPPGGLSHLVRWCTKLYFSSDKAPPSEVLYHMGALTDCRWSNTFLPPTVPLVHIDFHVIKRSDHFTEITENTPAFLAKT